MTQSHRNLLSSVLSEDYESREIAGRLIAGLLMPGFLCQRRVDAIRLLSRNVNERHISLDLDLRLALDLSRDLGLDLDLLPLMLTPKSLVYDLDVSNSAGEAVSVANREVDAKIAQSFLVAFAQSKIPALPLPNQRIWDLIWRIAYRFPQSTHLVPDAKLSSHVRQLGNELPTEDLDWWQRASDDVSVATWIRQLELNCLLTVRVASLASGDLPDIDRFQLLKIRQVESAAPAEGDSSSGLRKALMEPANPGKRIVVPLVDLGRAKSEHVRLEAPAGTFLADGALVPFPESALNSWRIRASRTFIALYARKSDRPSNAFMAATLWPEPRGFITPLKLLSLYSLVVLGVITVAQFLTGVLDHFGSLMDALFAIVMFLPVLTIGFLFRPDEDEIRWDLLRPWRGLAFMAVLPLWVTLIILLVGSAYVLPIWLVLLALGLADLQELFAFRRIWTASRLIHVTVETVRKLEKQPIKGGRTGLLREDQ